MIPIETTRGAWKRASTFPSNKELIYPQHAIVQEFDANKGKRVLEYGCGGGADTLSYLRRGCIVFYVDVVPENVKTTQDRIHASRMTGKAYGLLLDASVPIPLGAGYFEVISAHGVLHHIENPVPVLAEFRRLIHPQGALYVMLYTETLRARFEPTIRALVLSGRCETEEEAFSWCTDGEGTPYARSYTEEEGRALLTAAGFDVVSATAFDNNDFRTYKAVPR
jgi:2-polyprenyl-3-methyl-5-hydroxy-6-metoxy-1,4-benzoquinol methylase